MNQHPRPSGNIAVSTAGLVVSVVVLTIAVYLLLQFREMRNLSDHKLEKNLAGELAENNLPNAALEEYKRILDDPGLDNETSANICYLTAQIYFEKLADYENAAAFYIRARNLSPNAGFANEAGRNLIASLERMGRVVSAKRELDRAVNLDSSIAIKPGETLVAKIGESPIYLSDIDNEIQSLSPDAQREYLGKPGKMGMLNQMVALELMYRAALREKFDSDPRLLKRKQNLEKQLLVEKYVTERIIPQINIDTLDMRNFYLANRDSRYSDKPFDEIRSKVLLDYQQEKSQKTLNELINKLAEIEQVKLFEENVR